MDSFFGREKEIALLRRERETARRAARFTVLTGRRRVGKTALVRKALDDGVLPYVHLPITRQPESTLCGQMQEEAERARAQAEDAQEHRVQQTLLALRERFGSNAVVKGMSLQEGATAIQRNEQIGGHKA